MYGGRFRVEILHALTRAHGVGNVEPVMRTQVKAVEEEDDFGDEDDDMPPVHGGAEEGEEGEV